MPGPRSVQERLLANRRLTHWLIEESPTVITLVPRTEPARQPGGGFKSTDGVPRDPQKFKLIFTKSTTIGASIDTVTGVIGSTDNSIHEYDFSILGEWDAEIAIGDQWVDENGQNWVIDGFQPYNKYEIRAGAKSYGSNPSV